jgi:hypothetical protein
VKSVRAIPCDAGLLDSRNIPGSRRKEDFACEPHPAGAYAKQWVKHVRHKHRGSHQQNLTCSFFPTLQLIVNLIMCPCSFLALSVS